MILKRFPIDARHLMNLGCALLAAAGVCLSAASAMSDETKAELNQIRQEFNQINQQLRVAQQKAMADEEVLANQNEYSEALREEMLEVAGDSEAESIRQRFEILDNLQEAGDGRDLSEDERQTLMSQAQQLQTLRQAQKPIEDEARQAPEVQQMHQRLIASIQEAMREANPEVPQLMQRQNELANRARELQQQS